MPKYQQTHDMKKKKKKRKDTGTDKSELVNEYHQNNLRKSV